MPLSPLYRVLRQGTPVHVLSWPSALMCVALSCLWGGCGGGQAYPAVQPEPTPRLPVYRAPEPSTPQVAQRTPPPLMGEDPRLPPPREFGPSCKRVAIGPTAQRPLPIDYNPVYPIEVSQNGRAAEGLKTQARRAVRCYFPDFEAVDIVMRRDEQHRDGALGSAVVGVRGPGCETFEVEFELQADWTRLSTRLDVRRSTIPRPSRTTCRLAGGWKAHAAQLAPWELSRGDSHGALGLAVLVYSGFHPGTARTAGCVLGVLRRLMSLQGHSDAEGRLQQAGLRVLQQLLRVEPGLAQLVAISQEAASEFSLGPDAQSIEEAVEASDCFGAR